jgi:SAM-dependent methyltransferase
VDDRADWQLMQDEHHDGEQGVPWPHIRPGQPRELVVSQLGTVIKAHARNGRCRVLDVGAGHGTFTAEFLALGATEVICTEMSARSAQKLRQRFREDPRVTVIYDPLGEECFRQQDLDVVCLIAVLHHIPDYIAVLDRLVHQVVPNGSLVTFQDPTYYPRRTRRAHWLTRVSYLMWRVTRGDLREGCKSFVRRLTGTLDERNPRDMVEYHAVRNGVDELRVADALRPHFGSVRLITYWSTHNPWAQRVIGRTGVTNVFGVIAEGRRPHSGGS